MLKINHLSGVRLGENPAGGGGRFKVLSTRMSFPNVNFRRGCWWSRFGIFARGLAQSRPDVETPRGYRR
jgi:hypothetical protein